MDFPNFLQSLKREDNTSLIESIERGYNLLFEASVAKIVNHMLREEKHEFFDRLKVDYNDIID